MWLVRKAHGRCRSSPGYYLQVSNGSGDKVTVCLVIGDVLSSFCVPGVIIKCVYSWVSLRVLGGERERERERERLRERERERERKK